MRKDISIDFSVVIPHYRAFSSLKKLLDSIPTSDANIQVIVIDDHSGEPEQLSSLEKTYPKVLFLPNEPGAKGAGAARNQGIKHARGRWLLFADADDFFLPGAFETFSRYLDATQDIVFFAPTSIYSDTLQAATRHRAYAELVDQHIETGSQLIRYKFPVPWSKLIKRELVIRNNISFEETIASNDVMFSLKAGYAATEIAASRHSVYCATRGPGSLTTNISEPIFEARYEVAKRYNKFIVDRRINAPPLYMKLHLLRASRYGPRKMWTIYKDIRRANLRILPPGYWRRLMQPAAYVRWGAHVRAWLGERRYLARK